ncbi:hypothetical protein ABPG72_005302 [Tetrahymena utriculariae]
MYIDHIATIFLDIAQQQYSLKQTLIDEEYSQTDHTPSSFEDFKQKKEKFGSQQFQITQKLVQIPENNKDDSDLATFELELDLKLKQKQKCYQEYFEEFLKIFKRAQ